MTDQFHPEQTGGFGNPKAESAVYAKAKQFFSKERMLIPVVLIAFLAASCGGGSTDSVNASNGSTATETAAPKAEAPVEIAETSGQRNAKRAAENYLSVMPFSRDGLIGQLSSEFGDKYTVGDATYGVDALDADWNEQAYRSAKNYLSIMPFSRDGLIEQLSSDFGDKYTVEQATYGADRALSE